MTEATIVFREHNMTGSRKIYVDTFDAAATLAAKYRNASHYVDVINRQDLVSLRWEQGSPDWKLGLVKPIKLDTEEYRFERPDIDDWNPTKRGTLLSQGITCAFNIATGCHDDEEHDRLLYKITASHLDVWGIVEEGRDLGWKLRDEKSPDAWNEEICAWLYDSSRLYLPAVVELVALCMKNPELHHLKWITDLEMKLADRHAKRLLEAGLL